MLGAHAPPAAATFQFRNVTEGRCSAGLRFLWRLRPSARRECGLDARKTLARRDQLGIEPARDAEIVERLGEPAELLPAQPALDIEIGVHRRIADGHGVVLHRLVVRAALAPD